jgi:dolichol-phosphate mannosyltransferase
MHNFDMVEEIIIKLSLYTSSFKIYEVPVFFDQRRHGESKRDLKKFILTYITTIIRLLTIKYHYLSEREGVK